MKFVCLGYIEPNKLESLTEGQRNAMMDECFAYDDTLRSNGHFAGGEAFAEPTRVEAHAPDLSRLQQRDVLFGDTDAFGEFARAHFALGEHDVEVDDDRHELNEETIFFGHTTSLGKNAPDHSDEPAK